MAGFQNSLLMWGKDSSNYNDSVVITIKGKTYKLERILITFTNIDLSNNRF